MVLGRRKVLHPCSNNFLILVYYPLFHHSNSCSNTNILKWSLNPLITFGTIFKQVVVYSHQLKGFVTLTAFMKSPKFAIVQYYLVKIWYQERDTSLKTCDGHQFYCGRRWRGTVWKTFCQVCEVVKMELSWPALEMNHGAGMWPLALSSLPFLISVWE